MTTCDRRKAFHENISEGLNEVIGTEPAITSVLSLAMLAKAQIETAFQLQELRTELKKIHAELETKNQIAFDQSP